MNNVLLTVIVAVLVGSGSYLLAMWEHRPRKPKRLKKLNVSVGLGSTTVTAPGYQSVTVAHHVKNPMPWSSFSAVGPGELVQRKQALDRRERALDKYAADKQVQANARSAELDRRERELDKYVAEAINRVTELNRRERELDRRFASLIRREKGEPLTPAERARRLERDRRRAEEDRYQPRVEAPCRHPGESDYSYWRRTGRLSS